MQITVAQGAVKHQLSVEGEETVRAVKARLEELCSIPVVQQKLLVKGKEAADASTVATLGIADGARLMLLKNAQGHKPAPASAASTLAANNPANNPAAVGDALASASPTAAAGPAAAASGATSAPPVVVGSGSIELVVTHGKARYVVRCEAETTLIEAKRLLQPLCGAPPAQQRLLVRGRQASERGASMASLGLGSGGKAMLLFGEAHHVQAEHKAAVLEAATDVPRLTERLAALQRQGSRRLVESGELLASLALLDEQIAALQQDMENAGMHGGAGGEAEEARVARLAELGALREEVAKVRQSLQLEP